MQMAPAARNSRAPSRDATASMLLAAGASKPSSGAVASRSSASVEPARAPEPRGQRDSRASSVAKRPASRPSISTKASQWWASRTGWARWRWV